LAVEGFLSAPESIFSAGELPSAFVVRRHGVASPASKEEPAKKARLSQHKNLDHFD
jgi:hypothetical protein